MSTELDAALRETLSRAVLAPFYQRHFQDLWRQVHTVSDLAKLPLLHKATAIEHQTELWAETPPPGLGGVSSGTSGRDPLAILNVTRKPWQADAASTPLTPGYHLAVLSMLHGLPQLLPGPNELFVGWHDHRSALAMIEFLLTRPQPDGRRVSSMTIGIFALKAFYFWLLDRDLDAAALGLRRIGTYGYRPSAKWRQVIERAFACELVDNYSVSELPTPASDCLHCGWMHFRDPPMVTELLDPLSLVPRQTGAGLLVLTGLFPWVRTMPLIRYMTDDIVELGDPCATTGLVKFRYLGRRARVLTVKLGGESQCVLAPRWIEEVLETLPEVAREENALTQSHALPRHDIGLPRWMSEIHDGEVRLAFEVRFDPMLFPERARRLADEVRDALLGIDVAISNAVKNKALRLAVVAVPEKSLDPPRDKFA